MNTSIFDLDDTLCKVNTSFHFGIYLSKIGVLPVYKFPLLLGCYFLHKLQLFSISDVHHYACKHFFSGKSIGELAQHVTVYLDKNLEKMLDPSMYEMFVRFKKEGYYTVLLSSSPDFLVKEIAERLEFDAWAGTEYTLSDGQTIDRIGTLMEGESKARYVKDLMAMKRVSKERITAYSDSHLDIPFLHAVGHPVAVNPDRRLKKYAGQLGWKVIRTV